MQPGQAREVARRIRAGTGRAQQLPLRLRHRILFRSARMMAELAALTGPPGDAREFTQLADRVLVVRHWH